MPLWHNGHGSELPLVSREHRHEPIQALRDATYMDHRIIWRGSRYMCYLYWYVQCKAYTTSKIHRHHQPMWWETMIKACTLRPACLRRCPRGGAPTAGMTAWPCHSGLLTVVRSCGVHPWQRRWQEMSSLASPQEGRLGKLRVVQCDHDAHSGRGLSAQGEPGRPSTARLVARARSSYSFMASGTKMTQLNELKGSHGRKL